MKIASVIFPRYELRTELALSYSPRYELRTELALERWVERFFRALHALKAGQYGIFAQVNARL